jgi:YfiH family protein
LESVHNDIRLLQFEGLARQPGLIHAVTTRPANMAPHRGVGCERSVEWRRQICDLLGIPFDRLTAPAQVHGGDSLLIEDCDVGRGRDGRETAVAYVDGLLTDRRDVPMIVLSADCPVICAFDPRRPAIGAVHASWQGTIALAAAQLVRMMTRAFDSDPAQLRAAICPSAGPCCYEVGEEVRRVARTKLNEADSCFVERGEKLYFDLWTANRRQMLDQGVSPAHIELAGLCSICDSRFWSHRRDGAEAGRFGLIAALRA